MTVDIMADLAQVCDDLTNPRKHREPRGHYWDAARHRRTLPDHEVTLPGLITQVGQIVYPSGQQDDGTCTMRPVPGSRIPGNPKAVTCYLEIHIAVTRWHVLFGLTLRDTIESSIRQLLGKASSEHSDTQVELLDEMRRWRHQCEIVTRWRDPDPELDAPCPVEQCGARTLRVNLAKRTARCNTCGARWAEEVDEDRGIGSIGVLGRHIQAHRAESTAASRSAWDEERARKARRTGRAA